MSIVMALIVLAMVGISAITIMAMGSQKRKVSQQMNISVSANLVKQRLVGVVLSPQSWQITQNQNSAAFAAFSPDRPPALDIYTPDSNTPYYKVTDATAGFDLKGIPCNDFRATGNDLCPIRYDITLKNRVFQNGNWIDTLHFALQFKPSSTKVFLKTEDAQYTFDLVRNLNDQSVEYACISMNGKYDATTNTCSTTLTKTVTVCTGGKTYRGPAANGGSSNCDDRTVATTSCSGSQVVKGFSTNGSPICGAPL
jgi:hypothetical protein